MSVLTLPASLYAAEIRLVAIPTVAAVGEEAGVLIALDTEGKTVTALSGQLTITGENGEGTPIARIRDGDSIIGAWLTKARTNDDGKINFSGIIPGGMTSGNGKILTVYLIPLDIGTLTATFSGEVFFDSSPGEPVSLERKSVAFPVRASQEETPPFVPGDDTPPGDIRGIVAQNEAMFDGKPFIVVYARDDESGVLMYELLETAQFEPLESLVGDQAFEWHRIENPAALFYPINTRYIYVRATDREGNRAVALIRGPSELSPEKTATLFNKWLILAILIAVAGYALWLWFRRRKNHAQSPGSFTNAP